MMKSVNFIIKPLLTGLPITLIIVAVILFVPPQILVFGLITFLVLLMTWYIGFAIETVKEREEFRKKHAK